MRDDLTPRELQAAVFAANGLSNRQIAEQMQVKTTAVNTYLHNVYEKTGASGRADLAQQVSLK